MTSFNQISYGLSPNPSINPSTWDGGSVYNPIKGSFIIGTRSQGTGNEVEMFFFPYSNYSSTLTDIESTLTFTNLLINFVATNAIEESINVPNIFVKAFCIRPLPNSNNFFEASSDEGISTDGDIVDGTYLLSFNSFQGYFTLKLGSSDQETGGVFTTLLGTYKGTFILF